MSWQKTEETQVKTILMRRIPSIVNYFFVYRNCKRETIRKIAGTPARFPVKIIPYRPNLCQCNHDFADNRH